MAEQLDLFDNGLTVSQKILTKEPVPKEQLMLDLIMRMEKRMDVAMYLVHASKRRTREENKHS